jgi:hypothetical protein
MKSSSGILCETTKTTKTSKTNKTSKNNNQNHQTINNKLTNLMEIKGNGKGC